MIVIINKLDTQLHHLNNYLNDKSIILDLLYKKHTLEQRKELIYKLLMELDKIQDEDILNDLSKKVSKKDIELFKELLT